MQLQKTSLVQEQRLKMSPQLLQSIKLMALPVQDLKERIQEELDRNPALEMVDEKAREADIPAPREDAADPGADGTDAPYDDVEYESYASLAGPARGGAGGSAGEEEGDSKRMFLEGAISKPETLHEHLLWQLRLQPLGEADRRLGELLIDNLDDKGFHKEEPHALLAAHGAAAVDRMIAMVRGFEPVGCCVSGFLESLVVQARLAEDRPPFALEILEGHFEALERGKRAEIARKLKADEDAFERALAFIKGLDPAPGRRYSAGETRFVVPDLLVRRAEGEFSIVLNDEEIPVLGLNPFFMELSAGGGDKAARDFARENMKEARWFIQSINQRNHTLLRVARAIVEFQRAFFAKGAKHLAPLTLKDVAQEIGVHETTVSRIANGKFMQTEWGIFELRYFFTNSISGSGSQGSRFSKEGVKQVIKEIIEGAGRKLADQEIAEALAKKGIQIARRTVAKYRGELQSGLPPGRRA